MDKCRHCKFWGNSWEKSAIIKDCDFPKTIQGEKVENTSLAIMIDTTCHDDSGLDVVMYTGKDFYCPHFDRK